MRIAPFVRLKDGAAKFVRWFEAYWAARKADESDDDVEKTQPGARHTAVCDSFA